jgi:peptidoglycan/xylan/chitin deacetylase (PgdA/CDA1 family)
MANMRKDIFGAVAVGFLAVVLFMMFMSSMVLLGQTAGRMVIAGAPGAPEAPPAAVDSTAMSTPPTEMTTAAAVSDSSATLRAPLFGRRMGGPYDGVPVLCYHYLRGATSPARVVRVFLYVVLSLPVLADNDVWTLSESAFEKQMRYLHDNGYETITLDDLTRWQYGHKAIPRKAVVITFDDGDRSVYDYAFPILKKYGFKATYFVITAHVGRQWEGLELLTWSQLREMKESGVFEIASHTNDLHYKSGERGSELPVFVAASLDGHARWEDAIHGDLTASRDSLLHNVGATGRYLAWPYGHGNDAVDRVALGAGFARVVLLRDGLNPSFVPARGDTLPALERARITRFAVSARTSMRGFRQMLSGEYVTAQGY